ncbi:MAG TPA: response regulator [Vicinamibacterales bacterium]|nr:response regulator [Vicinamibacterales bacterium]
MTAAPTILLAEDDRFLRRAVEVALTKRGYHVIAAVDGQEALDKAREHKPALILLDLLMPRLTGMEVLDALRSDPAMNDVKVLILSNSSKELAMHDASRLGVSGYWIKANLSLQELGDRVATFLPPGPPPTTAP